LLNDDEILGITDCNFHLVIGNRTHYQQYSPMQWIFWCPIIQNRPTACKLHSW